MRNHFVPQFLLRQWIDDSDKKLEAFRMDIKNLPSSRLAPSGTAYEDDLYALSKDQVAGMSKHAIEEKFLKIIDSNAALVLEKLRTQKLNSLSGYEMQDWARFLMSLRARQPEIITLILESSEKNLRKSLSDCHEEYKKLASKGEPQTLGEWAERRFPGLIENFGLSFFHSLVDSSSIGTKILEMTWWVWDFTGLDNHLLLADNPCIFTKGIDDEDLVIALPISPNKAFMATKSERVAEIMRNQSAKTLLAKINESSISQAKKRIYARNESPRRFITNRFQQ